MLPCIPLTGLGDGHKCEDEARHRGILLEDIIARSISPSRREGDAMEDEIVEESSEETFIIDTIGAQPLQSACLPLVFALHLPPYICADQHAG